MNKKNGVIFLVLSLIMASIVTLEYFLTAPTPLPIFPENQLTDTQEIAVNVIVSRSNTISGWNIALIGAVSLMFVSASSGSISTTNKLFAGLALFLSIASIYASHLILTLITQNLIASQNLFYNRTIDVMVFTQFISTLLSALLFFLLAYNFYIGKKE